MSAWTPEREAEVRARCEQMVALPLLTPRLALAVELGESMPAALDEIERLRAEVERLRAALDAAEALYDSRHREARRDR